MDDVEGRAETAFDILENGLATRVGWRCGGNSGCGAGVWLLDALERSAG